MNFRHYLQMEHQKDYTGTDDNAPDAFEQYIVDKSTSEKLELVVDYLNSRHSHTQAEILSEWFFEECIDKI